MSWITIVWSMNAASCLTLAAIYLVVWCKQREGWAHLLFSVTAVAAAAIAAFELDDACRDGRPIRSTPALDTCARMGADSLVRGFRAALSPRRTTMARVEYLQPAHTGPGCEFYCYAEHQLPANYKPPPLLMVGWQHDLDAGRRGKPVGSA